MSLNMTIGVPTPKYGDVDELERWLRRVIEKAGIFEIITGNIRVKLALGTMGNLKPQTLVNLCLATQNVQNHSNLPPPGVITGGKDQFKQNMVVYAPSVCQPIDMQHTELGEIHPKDLVRPFQP